MRGESRRATMDSSIAQSQRHEHQRLGNRQRAGGSEARDETDHEHQRALDHRDGGAAQRAAGHDVEPRHGRYQRFLQKTELPIPQQPDAREDRREQDAHADDARRHELQVAALPRLLEDRAEPEAEDHQVHGGLRQRRDDILILSEEFLTEIGRGLGRPPAGISRDARQRLIDYHWPGNVRELRNILERAAILCDGGLITTEHLALASPSQSTPRPLRESAAAASSVGPPRPASAGDLHAMERAMIEEALKSARFNKSKAAKALGLTRHQLYIRMRKHGLEA